MGVDVQVPHLTSIDTSESGPFLPAGLSWEFLLLTRPPLIPSRVGEVGVLFLLPTCPPLIQQGFTSLPLDVDKSLGFPLGFTLSSKGKMPRYFWVVIVDQALYVIFTEVAWVGGLMTPG